MNLTIIIETGDTGVEWHFAQTICGDVMKLLTDNGDKYLALMQEWQQVPKCEFSFVIENKTDATKIGGVSYEMGR